MKNRYCIDWAKPSDEFGYSYIRIFVFLLMAVCSTCFADQEEITLAGRHTVYWAPQGATSEKQPLLLFSHGYGGCATQATFLMEALANNGFWVFAPDHDDARCGHRSMRGGGNFSLKAFRTPENWNDTTYADRRDDLVNLLNALKVDPRFSSRVDFSRVGLLGHSLGGYTVLGLAGAWPSWRLDGVRAVLALSPYSQPFSINHTLSNIRIPVMFQSGTLDYAVKPSVSKGGGSYQQSNAQKYYVEFKGAGHLAWTNFNKSYAESINAYSVAFLSRYVKGSLNESADLTLPRKDVSRLVYDSELGRSKDQPAAGEPGAKSLRERIGASLQNRVQSTPAE
jgi:predicted dienelactone hydrolase